MKNETAWTPSKFVLGPRGLRASRDAQAVGVQSRMSADLMAAFLERALREHATGALLDLGCGRVPLYQVYRPYVSEITCLDWERSPHQTDHIDLTHDLTEPLPFDGDRFDTILISDVLEHVPEPARLWDEMARVMVPGGKVILNVPFLYWLHEEPFDFYRYTEFALRRFAERSRFEVIELTPIGGAAEVVTDIACKALGAYRFGRRPSLALQWLCERLSSTRAGRKLRARTARKVPLGYGMIAQRKNSDSRG